MIPNLARLHDKRDRGYHPTTLRDSVFPTNKIRRAVRVPTGATFHGHSMATAIASITIATAYVALTRHGNGGIFDFVNAFADNIFNIPLNCNFGNSSTTSRNLLDRLDSTSIATSGNPASVLTGVGVDARFNASNTPVYSPVGISSDVVFLVHGVNDQSSAYFSSPLVSMQVLGQILDKYAPKTVIAYNEIPRGTGCAFMESHAVAAHTCTATNTAGFQDGSTVGIQGLFNGTTGAPYTKVASAPNLLEYSVTSGGVYTFNASDTISIALLQYTFTVAVAAAAIKAQNTLRYWWLSRERSFLEISTNGTNPVGFNYGVPGALYKRPHVEAIDSAQMLDDSAGSCIRLGSKDGLHPASYGSQIIATGSLPQIVKRFPGIVSVVKSPLQNNMQIATGNGGTKVYNVTLPATMRPILPKQLHIYTGEAVPSNAFDDGAGNISGTGITSGTINYNTGALSLTFTAFVPNTVQIFAYLDHKNVLENGLMDYNAILGTNAAVSTGASGTLPKPWTESCTNMGGVTAAFSQDTDDDGFPAVKVVLTTATGVIGTNPTIKVINGNWRQVRNQINPVGPFRIAGSVKITAGPDGHLTGISGAWIELDGNMTAFNKGAQSVTSIALSGMQGLAGTPLTDANLALNGGVLKYVAMSPTCDLTGATAMTGNALFAIGVASGHRVSGTFKFSRCTLHQAQRCSQET